MLSAIDTAEKLHAFLPLVEQLLEEGLVVISDVDIIKYTWRHGRNRGATQSAT